MTLVDHHCHLDFPDFAPEVEAIVARAHAAGVGLMVTISTRIRRHAEYRALAERFPGVLTTVGTHPHYAHTELDVPVDEIVALSRHPRCIAIGEAGLDYHYDKSPRDAQRTGFLNHVAAARETQLPLVIHSREADADMADLLEAEMAKGAFPFVLHCFTGGMDLARRSVALGGYVSASGVITFKGSTELRDVFASVPMDRLLVETDAPYLAPPPYRGKRNEPAYVVHTARTLAELKGVSYEEIATVTTDNFFRLYAKAARSSLQPAKAAAETAS
ncbi:MAG: TatD family hydrolase [Hyphomicrobiales bacterium]|nr:TatD family hydrolase [Hyphomicrobiales bacterium]